MINCKREHRRDNCLGCLVGGPGRLYNEATWWTCNAEQEGHMYAARKVVLGAHRKSLHRLWTLMV